MPLSTAFTTAVVLRRPVALLAAFVVVVAGVSLPSGPAGASVPTHRHVARPLTATGHLAPGYHLVVQNGPPLDCTFPEPSPGAVDDKIRFCGPSAAYAVACWRDPNPGFVDCLRDATGHRVDRLPATLGAAAVHAPAHPSPLVIRLANGERCSIRDGGAWDSPKQHPTWVGTYSCNRGNDAVWATPAHPATNGVNMSHASWTVVTGPVTGPWHTSHVADAWFVGNHR